MSISHTIRVLEASTGKSYPINLHPNDITVRAVREYLNSIVPLQDQILLLGPPYKVPKDSTLQSEETLSALRLGDCEDNPHLSLSSYVESNDDTTQKPPNTTRRRKRILSTTERSGARRLFLFSKRTFSGSSPDPLPCKPNQPPTPISLPTDPEPSPISFPSDTSPSPLHQALQAYERQFMLQLNHASILSSTANERLLSLQTYISEQAVMALALRAAVSNLSDHRNAAARTRTDLHTEFQSRLRSEIMGDSLEDVWDRLARMKLHSKLVELATVNGRRMETLLDTVLVERERVWWNKCKDAKVRLEQLFCEIDQNFGQLQLGSSEGGGVCSDKDIEAEEHIERLWAEEDGAMKDLTDRQKERLVKLESDYNRAVDVVLDALGMKDDQHQRQEYADQQQEQQQEGEEGQRAPSLLPSNKEGEAGGRNSTQRAFITLEKLSNATEDIIPSMQVDDATLSEAVQRVASQKTEAMKRMKLRLRQVSHAQSAIQKVLSSVSVLKDALNQWEEDVSHLEHTRNLPLAYVDFLSECRRRRAYGEAIRARAGEMVEVLGEMRTEEVRLRERFLRGSGRHLMPAFFEVFVPTLATPPPLFAPQLPVMVEMDTLPDFGEVEEAVKKHGDANVGTSMEGAVSSISVDADQLGTTSEISTDHGTRVTAPPTGSGDMAPTASGTSSIEDGAEHDDNVILGATTTSATGSMAYNSAESETRQAMLAYENSILRQVLERTGGHAPRVYVEKAKKGKEEESSSILALRKELEDVKKKLAQSKSKLELKSKKLCDLRLKQKDLGNKISYANFKVGDVALFMPTPSREKRGYLAFHINSPHKYLNTDSIEGHPDYVLGRIVIQDELMAGAKGTDENPHGLAVGTKFWILTVEVLKIQVPKGSSVQSSQKVSSS